jgi:hypothetical protein
MSAKSMQEKPKESKQKSLHSLGFFGRFGPFQCITTNPNRKNPFLSPLAPEVVQKRPARLSDAPLAGCSLNLATGKS